MRHQSGYCNGAAQLPPIRSEPPANLCATHDTNHRFWLLKTSTHVFNTNPSFHVPAFICRSAKPGDKQNGTTRLQGTRCKQLIKGRRQEKKSSECLQEDWGTARAVRGGDIQTLYTLRRQEGGYVGNAVNHISSPYHRREDGQCGSSLASCLLVRFTAVVPQIVSFF